MTQDLFSNRGQSSGPLVDSASLAELTQLAATLEPWQDETMGADTIEKLLRINRFEMMCDFLRYLFSPYGGHGYVELRAISAGQKPARYWITAADIFNPTKASSTLKTVYRWSHDRQVAGYDIYCGVLPRGKQSGRRADIYKAAFAWIDIDFKVGGEDKAFASIEKVEPDMVVLSGNGIHAYYSMKDVVSLTVENAKTFESSLRKMQHVLQPGGDSTHDLARVLRLPGFFNLKDKKNPRPVLLARVPQGNYLRGGAASDTAH